MPVSTRKANASVHPGQILLNSQQTRCTKQQVEDDNAMAKAAAHASQERAAEKHRAVVERIAQLEDEVALVEKDMQTHANRPDLQNRLTKSVSGRRGHLELTDTPGDDDSVPEEGDPDTFIGTGDFPGDDDRDEGPDLVCEDECDDNAGHLSGLEFSDDNAGDVTSVRYFKLPAAKKVSHQISVTYCSPGY